VATTSRRRNCKVTSSECNKVKSEARNKVKSEALQCCIGETIMLQEQEVQWEGVEVVLVVVEVVLMTMHLATKIAISRAKARVGDEDRMMMEKERGAVMMKEQLVKDTLKRMKTSEVQGR
jgi:hypothetical protein